MSQNDNDQSSNNSMFQGMPFYGYPYFPYYPPQMMQQPNQENTSQIPPQVPPMMMWPGMYMPQPAPNGYPWPGYPPVQQPMMPPPYWQCPPQQPSEDWTTHAEGMVDELMGEQASLFKNVINTLGVDDKEFWKGALIGAAAALILGNEQVRNTLLQAFSGLGEKVKAGGEKVKDSVNQAAQSIKETVPAGCAVFKDTLQAGRDGFHESLNQHRQQTTANNVDTAPKAEDD